MMISYPAYRFTLTHTLLQSFCQDPRRNEITWQLWQMPLEEFVRKLGKLSPPAFPVPEDVRDLVLPDLLPKQMRSILTIDNLSCLLDQAVCLSIFSCMEAYQQPVSLSTDAAMALLTDDTFWQQYQNALYHLICAEIQAFYTLDFATPRRIP